MKALDRRFVYDLQKKERRKSMIALTASFASLGSPWQIKKRQLLFKREAFIAAASVLAHFSSTNITKVVKVSYYERKT